MHKEQTQSPQICNSLCIEISLETFRTKVRSKVRRVPSFVGKENWRDFCIKQRFCISNGLLTWALSLRLCVVENINGLLSKFRRGFEREVHSDINKTHARHLHNSSHETNSQYDKYFLTISTKGLLEDKIKLYTRHGNASTPQGVYETWNASSTRQIHTTFTLSEFKMNKHLVQQFSFRSRSFYYRFLD